MRINSNRKLALRVLSTAALMAMVSSIATAAFADTYDLTKGSVTVDAKSDGSTYVTQKAADGSFCTNESGKTLDNYKDETPVTLTTKGEETHNTASINASEGSTAKVTLDKVNIDASNTDKAAISTKGNVTLELDGNNTLTGGAGHAALEKYSSDIGGGISNSNYTLTLQDKNTADGKTGSLTATGGAGGAGIGGSLTEGGQANNITITGGTITATGGEGAAGIGGGKSDSKVSADKYRSGGGDDITISGQNTNVTATGGAGGAGIGGGKSDGIYNGPGEGCHIAIKDGAHVTATGSGGGAGIGGGKGNWGQKITISDGEVTANGSGGGAGIGTGDATGVEELPRAALIRISGGIVTANGGADGGAGIGGGKETAASAMNGGKGVTITDGTVTATGGKGAAGIGSGAGSRWALGSFVDITGGTVTANGGAGEAAGIGNGENDAGVSTVKLSATTAKLDITAMTLGSGEAITGENGVTMASLTNVLSGVVRFFRGTDHYNTVHNGKYVGMANNNADEHKKTDAHIWDSAKDEIRQQASPAVQGIVRHHCAVDGCKGYYDEFFDYVAPAEPVTPAPTDPDTPDVPGTSDSTPAQGTPADAATADAVPGAATAEEVSVTPAAAQNAVQGAKPEAAVTAAALPKTGTNWLAVVGSAISGMVLLAAGFVLDRRSRRMN